MGLNNCMLSYILMFLLILFIFVYLFSMSRSVETESFSSNNTVKVRMFYVDWCGYCKTTKPEFKAFMDNYNNTKLNGKKLKIELINCEENTKNAELAEKMNVSSYPTIIAEKNGTVHNFESNDRSENGFVTWIKSI